MVGSADLKFSAVIVVASELKLIEFSGHQLSSL